MTLPGKAIDPLPTGGGGGCCGTAPAGNGGGHSVGVRGVAAIADALSSHTALRKLVLNKNAVCTQYGNIGGFALADALRVNTGLEELHLASCLVSDKGANAIFDALLANTHSALQVLNLHNNRVGHKGKVVTCQRGELDTKATKHLLMKILS